VLLGVLDLLNLDLRVVIVDSIEAGLDLLNNLSDLRLNISDSLLEVERDSEVITAGEADVALSNLLVDVGLEVAKNNNSSILLGASQLDADGRDGGSKARNGEVLHIGF